MAEDESAYWHYRVLKAERKSERNDSFYVETQAQESEKIAAVCSPSPSEVTRLPLRLCVSAAFPSVSVPNAHTTRLHHECQLSRIAGTIG